MKPIIYTTLDCPYCWAIKDWFNSIRVKYKEIDATTMDDIPVVPETHIGDDVFVGFERQEILKSLKSHGIIK